MREFIDIMERANLPDSFWKWFGSSKVVDAQGNPLVVYHGGASGISAFDKAKIGTNWNDKMGFFFTTNVAHEIYHTSRADGGLDRHLHNDSYAATAYATQANGTTYPCFLRIENPLTYEGFCHAFGLDADHEVWDYGQVQVVFDRNKREIFQHAVSEGHDGIIFRHGTDDIFVVFEPHQIKSIFSAGFDPNDPTILA